MIRVSAQRQITRNAIRKVLTFKKKMWEVSIAEQVKLNFLKTGQSHKLAQNDERSGGRTDTNWSIG